MASVTVQLAVAHTLSSGNDHRRAREVCEKTLKVETMETVKKVLANSRCSIYMVLQSQSAFTSLLADLDANPSVFSSYRAWTPEVEHQAKVSVEARLKSCGVG